MHKKNQGNSRKQKGSSCAVLQLVRDLHAFIYERGEKAGTRQDFILQSRDAKGHEYYDFMVRPFMNLNWKNLLLRSSAFSTFKKIPSSTL